jgi:TPR repeat protein
VKVDTYDIDLFNQADAACDAEDYDTAFKILKSLAESGDKNAYSNLAVMYECGQGVDVDFQMAMYWYKKAWRTDGDGAACSNIADFYRKQGNIRAARYWWNKGIARNIGDDALACAKSYLMKPTNSNIVKSRLLLLLAVNSDSISEDEKEEAQTLLTKDIVKKT